MLEPRKEYNKIKTGIKQRKYMKN